MKASSAIACFLLLSGAFLSQPLTRTVAAADAPPDEYHTPLAGAQCDIECLGRRYMVPIRNRENTAALVLGGSFFAPNLAGTTVTPIGALYYKHRWDDTRLRGTFSILVNDVDLSGSFGNLQWLGHLDNATIPFARKEFDGGTEVEGTAIKWGTINAAPGIGLKIPVAPYQTDNELRLQLFYNLGYLYSSRVSQTAPTVKLPPDTMVHGPQLRFRYDGFRRNLLELPHQGVAAGTDAEFTRRAEWSDASYGGPVFSKDSTQQYLKLSGYLDLATGIPQMSERNRILAGFHGGFAPFGTLDRFSAFRIGGGPIPSESDDLNRQVLPGALFGQFPVSKYLIGSAEYRREVFSFLYLHLRYTHAWLNREVFSSPNQQFSVGSGDAISAAVTTGFLWKSVLLLQYSYDSSLLRYGTNGSNIILLWSKSL